jgi:hypothetical protein
VTIESIVRGINRELVCWCAGIPGRPGIPDGVSVLLVLDLPVELQEDAELRPCEVDLSDEDASLVVDLVLGRTLTQAPSPHMRAMAVVPSGVDQLPAEHDRGESRIAGVSLVMGGTLPVGDPTGSTPGPSLWTDG